jgi:UDP-N-acetylmuramoyl-tripeptide--D-alanyl-D-alanine ligase
MIRTTLTDVAVMVEGELKSADLNIEGVSIDTRSLQVNNLFVPIIGTRLNGHNYVTEALSNGATAFLWQRDQGEPPDGSCVIVEDTLTALQQLASNYRSRLKTRIVGITGSNGKTSTKDMVAAVLGAALHVYKTQGNFNNHIGLPLTLLSLPEDVDVAVVEMGMSSRGEIELLTKMARPDVAVITNIGEAHLLQLGSREEIAKAKLEIVHGLREGGLLIVNGDEPLIQAGLHQIVTPLSLQIVRFGELPHCDLRLEDIVFTTEHTKFRWQGASCWYTIPMLGKHNAMNALAAIAVGRAFQLDEEAIVRGLAAVQPSGMRIERVLGKNDSMLWNDAYNANPSSMRAALDLLSSMRGYRRKIAVLGDMLELGPTEQELHKEIGRSITSEQIDYVFTCGPLGKYIIEGALETFDRQRVQHYTSKEELTLRLAGMLERDDLILVKASRGMKFETIIEQLRVQP